LQERWQEQAKALPLERKIEQALWQRFRAACDAIFAKRKETAHAADHERKAHLHAREAICKDLEAATFGGDDKAQLAAIAKTLRDAAAAWNASGAVPRAAEPKINQRYQNAVAAVQGQADAIKRRAGAAQANALRDKLRLCQALESAIGAEGVDGASGAAAAGASDGAAMGTAVDAAEWQSRWAALPALAPDYEKALHGRFTAALAALAKTDDSAGGMAGNAGRKAYAEQLERNRAKLLEQVLRLEIVAGVDSGAEFARERLKMQVEVLQSSLKSGQKPESATAAYLHAARQTHDQAPGSAGGCAEPGGRQRQPIHRTGAPADALLNQDDGGARSLLQRAGVNVGGLTKALKSALERLPKVSGTGGDVQVGRELVALLNLADREAQKRGDQFISSEMVLLALTDDKSDAGRLARENGLARKALESAIDAVRGGEQRSIRRRPKASAKR
jgi:hypothetical protein